MTFFAKIPARNVVVPQSLRPGPVPIGTVQRLHGETMGTTWSLKAPLDASELAGLRSEIEVLLASLVADLSAWERNSSLSRFNHAAPGWHTLPAALSTVLARALTIAHETGGAYDPTIWPLVELWGFGAGEARGAPDSVAVADAKRRCGFERIALTHGGRRAFQPGGLGLDVCSIAKGYAVDLVAEFLMTRGIGNFLVEIGGELRGEGMRPDANPWWVAVEAPRRRAAGDFETLIALHGLAVATSGDYRRNRIHDGRRVSHIIDPRTGYPVANNVLSVTVLHPSCMSADALATALFVLGEDKGIAFAAARWIAALFWLERDGCIVQRMTPAFAAMTR